MSDTEQPKQTATLSLAERASVFEELRKKRQAQNGQTQQTIQAQSRATKQFPLSFAQQRLWFLDQFEPNTALYTIPEALIIDGPLDVAALQHALDALVVRHETLRTTFVAVDGVPMQVIADPAPVPLPLHDLTAMPEVAGKDEAMRLVREEAERPFDLAQGPIFRAGLVRLATTQHILLLSMHHIISDGWSKGVLMRELTQLYDAYATGTPANLPALAIQYADFAVWQRSWLQGDALDKQLSYWKTQLAELPALQLPTDHPRPQMQTFRGAAAARRLSPALANQLTALSRVEKSSLFMVVLAAFDVLLSRYSGQDDFAVGTAIANRNHAEIENIIGFFVNSLVMRANLSGNPTFREVLGRVREVSLNAYAHQDLPFEQLVEELHPTRDLSGTPLIQVMLTLQNAPGGTVDPAGLRMSSIETAINTSKFDLTLFVIGDEAGLLLDAEYKSDLFEAATIDRMLANMEVLLTAIVADPDQRIADLPILAPAEREHLLRGWNASAPTAPTECLHERFATQAVAHAEDVAVVCDGAKLTYRALNERANQLAHHLRGLGVGPEVCVGLSMERSIDLIVGILGILKAGGAYVPLDPAYPRERLSFILNDSHAAIIVTQATLLDRLPATRRDVTLSENGVALPLAVCLDEDWPRIAENSTSNPVAATQPTNLAYVIYTSGSTGQPKGVLIPHAQAMRLFTATDAWYHFGPDDVWTLFHSYAFDFSVWELWGALLYGGRLVVVPRLVAQSTDAFYDLLASEQVTVLNQTPSAFRQLIQVEGEMASPKALALRYVIFGGEALNIQSLAPWYARHADDAPRLVNMYGITETTVHVTYYPLSKADLDQPTSSVIGYPIPDLQAYVFDPTLHLVPLGVAGELYVGGAGLARGYLNRPDLAAERFIPHPFSNESGARLYKTGDLVRLRADGNLEYLGRIDHQVKVRGFRIELGEIEAALHQHPAVNEAIVIVRADAIPTSDEDGETHDHKRLVAYVTRQRGAEQADGSAPERTSEQVAHWQQVFDTIYDAPSEQADPTTNFIGWNSSYTNQPIPEAEMSQWVDQTIDRIVALHPRRVLEIGVGTGLLLYRIAPQCETYWGTDLSAEALDAVRKQVTQRGLSQVTLLHRGGDDFSGPLAAEQCTFDTIIINSVAQYFPSKDYLLRVLEGAVRMLAPGGCIFLGDLRNLDLLEAFHTSVQLRLAPLTLLNEQLRQRVRTRQTQENEIVVAPAFFAALRQRLPRITATEASLKRGWYQNELSRFRYDVTLHVDRPVRFVADYPVLDWRNDALSSTDVTAYLATHKPECLLVKHIPNARVITDVAATGLLAQTPMSGTVGELWQALSAVVQDQGTQPEALWALGTVAPNYTVRLGWSDVPDCFDATLWRNDVLPTDRVSPLPVVQSAPVSLTDWTTYINTPYEGDTNASLVPELREFLKRRLPEYMVPALIMVLESLPLTNNGKVDRNALPSPDGSRPELTSVFVAPRNANERLLADIWKEVLGIAQVGINDNFFELGGDSLMSIRVVARASKAGLNITTKQLFQHQTIAELAGASQGTRTLSEQGLVTGPMRLLPANRFTFGERMGDPTSHTLSYLVEHAMPLDPRLLEAVAQQLLAHHDALRMRAVEHDGTWDVSLADNTTPASVWEIDLSGLNEVDQVTALRQTVRDIALHFDLAHEPLLRLALCELGPDQPTPLAVAGHSLVVDMQSWQFLMEDLQTVYRQVEAGLSVQLPPKTTSYKQWSDRLVEYAQSEELRAELPFWLSERRQQVKPLPMDFPTGENTGASLSMALGMLSIEETEALSRSVVRREGMQMDTVLLAAVATALMRWNDERLLLVTVEGHGRSPHFDDIDLSRTLGVMPMEYPILLDFATVESPQAILDSVNAELKQLASRGLRYAALRYMNPDTTVVEQLAAVPQPDLFFNYLATSVAPEISDFKVAGPYNGRLFTIDETTLQPLPLLVTGYLANGQLQVSWHYSANQYRAETMDSLAEQTIVEMRAYLRFLQTR